LKGSATVEIASAVSKSAKSPTETPTSSQQQSLAAKKSSGKKESTVISSVATPVSTARKGAVGRKSVARKSAPVKSTSPLPVSSPIIASSVKSAKKKAGGRKSAPSKDLPASSPLPPIEMPTKVGPKSAAKKKGQKQVLSEAPWVNGTPTPRRYRNTTAANPSKSTAKKSSAKQSKSASVENNNKVAAQQVVGEEDVGEVMSTPASRKKSTANMTASKAKSAVKAGRGSKAAIVKALIASPILSSSTPAEKLPGGGAKSGLSSGGKKTRKQSAKKTPNLRKR